MLAIREAHSRAGDNESRRGTNLRNGDAHWVAENSWLQLPGVFFSSEVESAGDEFFVEQVGHDGDSGSLYAVYFRAEESVTRIKQSHKIVNVNRQRVADPDVFRKEKEPC